MFGANFWCHQMGGRPELTAEWTVHAQLTITRPDHNRININLDHDATHPNKEPIKIFYNYSTEEVDKNCPTFSHDTGEMNKGDDNTYSQTFVFPAPLNQNDGQV